MKTITCGGSFPSGRFMTAHSCEIEHVKRKTRSVITVLEVAYNIGLGDDLFTIAHLSEGHERENGGDPWTPCARQAMISRRP